MLLGPRRVHGPTHLCLPAAGRKEKKATESVPTEPSRRPPPALIETVPFCRGRVGPQSLLRLLLICRYKSS